MRRRASAAKKTMLPSLSLHDIANFYFSARCRYILYTLVLSNAVLASASASASTGDDNDGAKSKLGYAYGQSVPVSCLSRSIETGEHVTDEAGTLHYTPFPICNETASPLAFRYGVSETVSCTLDALDDEMYHLLEYYVHSDVPLTCRVPTLPLGSSEGSNDGVAFTPLTVALQGTLQLSHLHMWTDMNVLLHRAGVSLPGTKKDEKKDKDKKKREKERKKVLKERKKQPGLVYAGTAYSLPSDRGNAEEDAGEKDEADDVENVSLDPWAAGHGAKVVRGEPLTFTFRVSWVHGEDVLEMTGSSNGGKGETTAGGVLSSMFFFLMAGGVGALLALSWDKWYKNRRGGGGWRGDGLLGGRSTPGRIVIGNSNFGSGKTNGYGGYNGGVTTNGGYGGYSSGKRD